MRLTLLLVPFVLIGCSYFPEPLNNPSVSQFGKKCNGDTWSYVWIHDKDKPLKASKEQCND